MEAIADRHTVFKLGYHWVSDEETAAEEVEFLRRLLYLPVGSKVLMPFCGPGWYAHELSMWGFKVLGIEYAFPLLKEAKQRSQQLGLSAEFLLSNHFEFPFRDGKFDGAMIVGNRFGMIGDEQEDIKFLLSLSRVLKPQASLVMALPHRDGILHQFKERDWETEIDGTKLLITRQWFATTGQMWEEWSDANTGKGLQPFVVIYRVYTMTELESLLERCGFKVTNAFGNFRGRELTHRSVLMVVQSVKQRKGGLRLQVNDTSAAT
ncbi:MAG: class I SAM-dependent methyltransferase [Candidatus Fervidibacter sp.]|uniref:class I SAM-dependent methyltransferase n=1 Tax=Candidatus Fervidibacter sp. TaxID=3100871 RepID=UPI00404B1F96